MEHAHINGHLALKLVLHEEPECNYGFFLNYEHDKKGARQKSWLDRKNTHLCKAMSTL